MLSDKEFTRWCREHNLSEATIAVIKNIRNSPPSRRVRGGRGNISGKYASVKKQKTTIQFESRYELGRIFEHEHDDDCYEYFDQPPKISISRLNKNGKRFIHLYTADFFVIGKKEAWWEEVKGEDELVKLSQNYPDLYCKDENGCWRCPPGEEFAKNLGLGFKVISSSQINQIFAHNLDYLEDFLQGNYQVEQKKKN